MTDGFTSLLCSSAISLVKLRSYSPSHHVLGIQVAYLTRADTSMPTPMVLLVHGGPWARDSWGYNSAAQWFANRGYAVLQVNYRGSSGYSKSFLHTILLSIRPHQWTSNIPRAPFAPQEEKLHL